MDYEVPTLKKDKQRFATRITWAVILLCSISCISCLNISEYFIPLYQKGVPILTIYHRHYTVLSPILPLLLATFFMIIAITKDIADRKKYTYKSKIYYNICFICILASIIIIIHNTDFIVRN